MKHQQKQFCFSLIEITILAPASIKSTGRVPRQWKRQFIEPQQDWDQSMKNKPEWISVLNSFQIMDTLT